MADKNEKKKGAAPEPVKGPAVLPSYSIADHKPDPGKLRTALGLPKGDKPK
jgi:hypothetical protein